MSDTKDQTNVMIGYLLQVMYERGETLRKAPNTKEGKDAAHIIVTLSRSISILREPYEYLNRPPDQEPQPDAQPEQPQAEPAEWDTEQPDPNTLDSTQEEPQPE